MLTHPFEKHKVVSLSNYPQTINKKPQKSFRPSQLSIQYRNAVDSLIAHAAHGFYDILIVLKVSRH